jgi:hypothetical protein
MINNLLTALAWGFASGIVGVVYADILSQEETFNKWWRWGNRFERSSPRLFKLLFVCSHCFAGQFALWTFFVCRILPWFFVLQSGWDIPRALFLLIFATAAAIFTAKTISFHLKKAGVI